MAEPGRKARSRALPRCSVNRRSSNCVAVGELRSGSRRLFAGVAASVLGAELGVERYLALRERQPEHL